MRPNQLCVSTLKMHDANQAVTSAYAPSIMITVGGNLAGAIISKK